MSFEAHIKIYLTDFSLSILAQHFSIVFLQVLMYIVLNHSISTNYSTLTAGEEVSFYFCLYFTCDHCVDIIKIIII